MILDDTAQCLGQIPGAAFRDGPTIALPACDE